MKKCNVALKLRVFRCHVLPYLVHVELRTCSFVFQLKANSQKQQQVRKVYVVVVVQTYVYQERINRRKVRHERMYCTYLFWWLMKRSESRERKRMPTINARTIPKLRQISSCLYSKTDSTYSLIVMWSMLTGGFVIG